MNDRMNKQLIKIFGWLMLVLPQFLLAQIQPSQRLKVSANKRFLMTADGKPFFWLGDTGWLLFNKLNKDEAEQYLETRKKQGFNVIQVMVVHDPKDVNVYGDSALVRGILSKPAVTKGNNFDNAAEYDYWDHAEYIVDLAAKKGIYMALVPVWGSAMKAGKVTPAQAKIYTDFLVNRFGKKWNIIWLNGGDIKGTEGLEVWKTIGNELYAKDTNHLITYHPRGRTSSSTWFHSEKWLAFNSFQSGHQRYNQDTSSKETLHYGEDNWKYVDVDYKLTPTKPVIDAEPSYEGIPQGLHDSAEVRWKAADVRRYGYWSVFAGAFGYTYGNNSVMQFLKTGEKKSAYGATAPWFDAVNDTGATQMILLKKLLLSRSYTSRVPDQSMVVNNGEKYDRVAATRGSNYAFFYTYTGKPFTVNLGKIPGAKVKAVWYDTRKEHNTKIGEIDNTGTHEFIPPTEGMDWVLVLDSMQ
jgi:hypothetical protein